MISIIGDVYTVVEDHTKVGGGGYSTSRGGSGVRPARGKKRGSTANTPAHSAQRPTPTLAPGANGRVICPYSRKIL